MTTSEPTGGQDRYYDPAEVEAYILEATTTIKSLQAQLREVTRRAEDAEHGQGTQGETASLGRALLLASEVAEKTIADADSNAAQILRSAEDQAKALIEAAHAEGDRLVVAARGTAERAFQDSEARLLAAVNAFVEGSNILRDELSKVKLDVTKWREPSVDETYGPPDSVAAPIGPRGESATPPFTAPSLSAPPLTDGREPASPPYADLPGGMHNRASQAAERGPGVEPDGSPYAPTPPQSRSGRRSAPNPPPPIGRPAIAPGPTLGEPPPANNHRDRNQA